MKHYTNGRKQKLFEKNQDYYNDNILLDGNEVLHSLLCSHSTFLTFSQVLVYLTGQTASRSSVSRENRSLLQSTGKTVPSLHNGGFADFHKKFSICNLKTTINKHILGKY